MVGMELKPNSIPRVFLKLYSNTNRSWYDTVFDHLKKIQYMEMRKYQSAFASSDDDDTVDTQNN